MTCLHDELLRAGVRRVEQVRRVRVDGPGNGRLEADGLVDGGADLVVVDAVRAEPATATATATAAVALLLDLEPVAAVGTTAAPDWAERVVEVRDTLRRVRPHLGDLDGLLDALYDPVLTRTTQLLEQLSARRTPVLLGDSTTVLAGGLLAVRRSAGAGTWWLASGRPAGPAGTAALQALGLVPLLDLELAGDASRHALAVVREAVGGA